MLKVILRSDIKGLGNRGDIVNVADAHARIAGMTFGNHDDVATVAVSSTVAS